MPITWRNVAAPENSAGLAAASAGLTQMARSLNQGIDIYAKREAEQNKQTIDNNVAIFQQRLQAANLDDPAEVARLENQLKTNPALFGSQTDELIQSIGKEPMRREQERLKQLTLTNNINSETDEAFERSVAPIAEQARALLAAGDIKGYRELEAQNKDAFAKSETLAKFSGKAEELQTGLDLQAAVTESVNSGEDPNMGYARWAKNNPNASSVMQTVAKNLFDTTAAAIQVDNLSQEGAALVAEESSKITAQYQTLFNEIQEDNLRIAKETGLSIEEVQNPESMVFLDRDAAKDPQAVINSMVEAVGGDIDDIEQISDQMYKGYVKIRDNIMNNPEKYGKYSPEVIETLVFGQLHKMLINDAWDKDVDLSQQRIEAFSDDALTKYNEKILAYQQLQANRDILTQAMAEIADKNKQLTYAAKNFEENLNRQNLNSRAGKRVSIADAYSAEAARQLLGSIRGGESKALSDWEIRQRAADDLAKSLVGAAAQNNNTGGGTPTTPTLPPTQTPQDARQYWPNVRW